MSKLDRIETFMKVAELSSFVGAARALEITPAAVSKQIALLEEELSILLIKRTTRRLSLTAIGETYLEHCKRIMDQLAEADNWIASSRAEPLGTLRVTSGRHFAERYIIPHLADWIQCYPKVQLNLELAERIPDLEQENIDILIGMSISGPSNAIQRTIAQTRYVLCASPSYLKTHGEPRTPADLTGHRYITHSMRRPDDTVTFKKGIAAVRVQPILWLNDARAMLACAIEGIGIVKLHEYVVADALETGKLKEVLINEAEDQVPIYLGYQAKRYVQPKIRRFIDFILSKL